ncbi:MAG: tRNA (guanosine(46)-N7)-methyltransferase TrmB [Myxococcota bacterium]
MRERHRIHGNPFSVRGEIEVPDWRARFGRDAPIAVDVGFGRGAFLLDLAAQHPEWDVVGIEIRDHLVRAVRDEAQQRGIRNLDALVANANMHFHALFNDKSLAFVSVNFPDPWFKKRHHKRRVVKTEWLDVVARKMCAGARFHAMSDYEPIAQEMLEVLDAHPRFENIQGRGAFAAHSTTGITSEREVSHSGRAQPIYRMHFRRTA